ncbi:MAG: hypothetical protein HRU15_09495 [Planctomycetes bacterium]|nr:hypothetical protein [Planctomycetota bacterium]
MDKTKNHSKINLQAPSKRRQKIMQLAAFAGVQRLRRAKSGIFYAVKVQAPELAEGSK